MIRETVEIIEVAPAGLSFLQLALSALGGALIATVGSLIKARTERVGEHEQWARNERLAAYVAMMSIMNQLRSYVNESSRLRKEYEVFAKAAREEGDPQSKNRNAAVRSEMVEKINTRLERIAEIVDAIPAALAPLAVLGPHDVELALERLVAVGRESEEEYDKADLKVRQAMRKALNIEPPFWRRLWAWLRRRRQS